MYLIILRADFADGICVVHLSVCPSVKIDVWFSLKRFRSGGVAKFATVSAMSSVVTPIIKLTAVAEPWLF